MPPYIYFIHVPKTAGTYLSRFLTEQLGNRFVREGHTIPPHALHPWTERFGPAHYATVRREDCLTISLVRNPYDLLVSMYCFGFPYWPPNTYPGRAQINWPFASFRDYVTKLCAWDDYPWICPEQKRSLYFQLFDDSGSCLADLILRQEAIGDGLRMLGQRFGETWEPWEQRIKMSHSLDYRNFFDESLIQMVTTRFAADLAVFGYGFDSHDGRQLIDGRDIVASYNTAPARIVTPPEADGSLSDIDFHNIEDVIIENVSGRELLRQLKRRLYLRLGLPIGSSEQMD